MTIPDLLARMRARASGNRVPTDNEALMLTWADELEAEWKRREEFLAAAMKIAKQSANNVEGWIYTNDWRAFNAAYRALLASEPPAKEGE